VLQALLPNLLQVSAIELVSRMILWKIELEKEAFMFAVQSLLQELLEKEKFVR
jgi:hypothetical protein